MGDETRNHELYRFPNGNTTDDIRKRWNENVETIDRLLTVRDEDANRFEYRPYERGAFRATDTGRIYNGTGEEWELADASAAAVDATATDCVQYVSTGAELEAAIPSGGIIVLCNDITLTDTVEATVADDLWLILRPYTIRRDDGMNATMLDITASANVWIEGGIIDGNRAGQNFPAEKHDEVVLTNDGTDFLFIDSLSVIDNTNFSIRATSWMGVLASDYVQRTHPEDITDPDDAGGLDGFHVFDSHSVLMVNPDIRAGDDAIAVGARTALTKHVNIRGGTVSSPIHANGVKLHTEYDADPIAAIETAVIDCQVYDTYGHGVTIVDDGNTGNPVEEVVIKGLVTGVGLDGVYLGATCNSVDVKLQVSDSANHMVNLDGGGENASVCVTGTHDGTVAQAATGCRINEYDEVVVSGSYDGMGVGTAGVLLVSVTDLTVRANVTSFTDAGIRIEGNGQPDEVVENVVMNVRIADIGGDGVLSVVPLQTATLDVQVDDPGNHGINIDDGGKDVRLDATVYDQGQAGIRLDSVENVIVSGVIDGDGGGTNGVLLENGVTNASLGLVVRDVDGNGITGIDSDHITVTGCVLSDLSGRPVYGTGTSDYWVLTSNQGYNNGSTNTSLSATHKSVANNLFS
ncbi:glycosyl hydrolase family 28 protein [Haladaptatus sp. R4]|uniref:glycosyl hydrolase family 28 protein n=1 Tax=Haladaptatus sp. R4 TaxID=1679489 RepID=UPI00168103C4|nr:glycosyl hydrolase family 28 protein [Haladaptatus sp. R4]